MFETDDDQPRRRVLAAVGAGAVAALAGCTGGNEQTDEPGANAPEAGTETEELTDEVTEETGGETDETDEGAGGETNETGNESTAGAPEDSTDTPTETPTDTPTDDEGG